MRVASVAVSTTPLHARTRGLCTLADAAPHRHTHGLKRNERGLYSAFALVEFNSADHMIRLGLQLPALSPAFKHHTCQGLLQVQEVVHHQSIADSSLPVGIPACQLGRRMCEAPARPSHRLRCAGAHKHCIYPLAASPPAASVHAAAPRQSCGRCQPAEHNCKPLVQHLPAECSRADDPGRRRRSLLRRLVLFTRRLQPQ